MTEIWIILAAVLFRMVGLSRPLLGNFSTYQTAQAMMAKFFAEEHFRSLLYPKLNVLVQGEPGLQLLYYPVSSLVTAVLVRCFGGDYGFWGRFQAVAFFALTAIFLFRLIRVCVDEKVARYALVFFILCPLTLIYGQSFQSEMATVFFSIFFFWGLSQFLKGAGLMHFVLSSMALSLSLLVRPNGLYLLAPAFYLAVLLPETSGEKRRRIGQVLLIFLISLILPGLWYGHVWRVSHEVKNIYQTIYSQLRVGSSFASPVILSFDYYRDLFDTVSGVVLTPIGFTLFLLGVPIGLKKSKGSRFFLLWCLAFLGSSLLIPRKLIDHNFYWLHFVAPASVFVGIAFKEILGTLKGSRKFRGTWIGGFIGISLLVSMRYGFHAAFRTSKEEASIPEAAKALSKLTDKSNSRIIAQGPHSLLYYADRFGWGFAIREAGEVPDYYLHANWEKLPENQWKERNEAFRDSISSLEYLRKYEGATHLVLTDPPQFYHHADFAHYVQSKFDLISGDKKRYLIFSLKKKLT